MSTPVEPVEDDLIFLSETTPTPGASVINTPTSVWRVMIIDDDADVHSATTFALGNLEMQHRPLEFLHAYSAAEARDLLKIEQDIAVILLDVVMEQDDAGLQLVRHIREVQGMTEARIILRTGQPGYAPEIDAIRDFDINDYKTKSELTRIKLFTTVTAAIRSYEQIRAINASRTGLELIVRASAALMAQQGLENFVSGVIIQIAGLLNLKPDGLLCVQKNDDDTARQLQVIGVAGRYASLINKPLDDISDAKVSGALKEALRSRSNIYRNDYTALHFSCNANRNFVAFIHTGRPLDDIEKRLLEVFCSNISVGLDNVVLIDRLHNFAFYDPLTALPNRTRFVQLLSQTLCEADKTDDILALVDIDHFSETNDALGHQFGDALLMAVATRLKAHLDDKSTLARVGGDTFGVLGHGIRVNPENMLRLFEEPFNIGRQAVQLSATVGLVRLADYEGCGTDALKDADIALKRAKAQQRAGHFYFSRSMGVDIRERVRMMYALRAAFEAGQLFVVYQPQVDLTTRLPTGAEALLRWKTEDGSFIPPDRFIPIAEYSGLIVELGEWVMREACKELVHQRKLGYTNFIMSINVSQVQFRHPHFLEILSNVIRDTGAPPEFVELEITESIAMEEPNILIKLLEQIKQTGISIAIDDFGTGFSSLSYLQQLKVDRLKIDRAFVTEITSSARGSSIAEMVIQLGRNLDLSVIAEGVENERQSQVLTALGCPQAQGYLFGQPMSPEQLTTWLKIDGPR